jgi:hypothetical protein
MAANVGPIYVVEAFDVGGVPVPLAEEGEPTGASHDRIVTEDPDHFVLKFAKQLKRKTGFKVVAWDLVSGRKLL